MASSRSELRQGQQGIAQSSEVARPGAVERHPRQDALHVADGLEQLTQADETLLLEQQGDCSLTPLDLGYGRAADG
jgi:hypothetical protein